MGLGSDAGKDLGAAPYWARCEGSWAACVGCRLGAGVGEDGWHHPGVSVHGAGGGGARLQCLHTRTCSCCYHPGRFPQERRGRRSLAWFCVPAGAAPSCAGAEPGESRCQLVQGAAGRGRLQGGVGRSWKSWEVGKGCGTGWAGALGALISAQGARGFWGGGAMWGLWR